MQCQVRIMILIVKVCKIILFIHVVIFLDYHIPSAASSYLSPLDDIAYFAFAFQNSLILYIMNTKNTSAISHQLKEQNLMPRLFSNIKDAFT